MAILENMFGNEYIRLLVIIIGTIIVLSVSYFILKLIVTWIAHKKKSYSEFILKQLTKPVLLLIFFIGLYSGVKPLSILIEYKSWIDGAFFIIFTFIAALVVARIITVIMLGYLKIRRGFERPPKLINKAISIIIFIIAIAVILGYFEVDITPLVAGVGLGALAIGLALQSTLSNFFAGMHLLSDRPIKIGDFIELDKDTSGFVEDIGWRSTRIKTMVDNLLIIPNAKLADSTILNYSMPKQDMNIWIPCGVAYESNLKKVEEITLEVARDIQQKIPGTVKDYEPLFRYREFGDSNINFIIVLRVEEPIARYVVRNEFIKALKERFDKEKIEISWPIRKLYQMK